MDMRGIVMAFALLGSSLAPASAHSASSSLVYDLDFLSPQTGWITVFSPRIAHVGAACDYDPSGTPITVYKTTDAGRHRLPQLHFTGVPPVTQSFLLPGAWMHFVSPSVGYVAGPVTGRQTGASLYRTRDGGR